METDSSDYTVKIHIVTLVNAKEFQRVCYEVVIYVPTAMQKVLRTSICLSISYSAIFMCVHTVSRLFIVCIDITILNWYTMVLLCLLQTSSSTNRLLCLCYLLQTFSSLSPCLSPCGWCV